MGAVYTKLERIRILYEMRKLVHNFDRAGTYFILYLLFNSDRPFSIFQKVHETRRNFPKDWEYHHIDQMNAPDLYQGIFI